VLETKETELKVIQSTDTFQGSRNYWDQSGQKWQSSSVKPKANNAGEGKPPEKVKKPAAAAPKPSPEKTQAGKNASAVTLKGQVKQDTFQGNPVTTATAKSSGSAKKTFGTLAFGLGCLAVGIFTKSRLF